MSNKLSDDHNLGALIEGTNDKVSGLVEAVSLIISTQVEDSHIFQVLEEQTALIMPMFAAIKDHSKILKNHERRIKAVENQINV